MHTFIIDIELGICQPKVIEKQTETTTQKLNYEVTNSAG